MIIDYSNWDEVDEFRWKPKDGFQAGEWNLREQIRRAYPELMEPEQDEQEEPDGTDELDIEEFPDCR